MVVVAPAEESAAVLVETMVMFFVDICVVRYQRILFRWVISELSGTKRWDSKRGK